MFYSHPLIIPQCLEKREYQVRILETAKKMNTLVVLPTGMGKTPLAIMLAADRLEKYPDSKVLILAPTRPLCAQHEKSFRDIMDLPKNHIVLVTGKIPPQNRYWYYRNARIISATPQTIKNDLQSNTLNLKRFSLLVVDEVHRAVKGYAYPYVVKRYMEQSEYPRVLGLTASPGGTEDRINEIRKNLFTEAVEIRTEEDEDVKPYVKGTEIEIIRVDLSEKLKKIRDRFKYDLNAKLSKLRSQGIQVYTRNDLLHIQKKFSSLIQKEKRPIYFHIVSWCAEAIKIWHALQLVETQSLHALEQYLERLKKKKDKSSQRVVLEMKDVIETIKNSNEEHPKLTMLRMLVRENLAKNPETKIIIFSHFRDNIERIYRELSKISGCKPVILIGQSGEKGLKQKEQINVLKEFGAGLYNCLITTSIGEEGIHVKSADIAIFYEPVGSEIRSIQRRGRVGRTKFGKVIILVAKKTSDEHRYYSSRRKEKKMKQILTNLRERKGLEKFL